MNAVPLGTLLAGRYQVVKTLAGGMGLVFLCHDLEEDLPVALKTFYVPSAQSDSNKALPRFEGLADPPDQITAFLDADTSRI